METRKPFTINGRAFAYPEFKAAVSSYPKGKEQPSIVIWRNGSRPSDGSVGGGRVVGK